VLTVEWLDPVMIGGLWMPELVAMAGGRALVTQPGQPALTLSAEELRLLDPNVVLLKPCGFRLERTLAELLRSPNLLPWNAWKAAAGGRVFASDGNAYFNRPGPRTLESLEILAACMHPELADLGEKHATSFMRIASVQA
jgi:iron complex transport system substrate-binding protein